MDRWKKLRDQIAALEQELVSDRELGDTRIRKRSFVSIFTRTIDLYFGIDLDRFVILLTILKRPPIEPSAKICGYVQWHISKDRFKLLLVPNGGGPPVVARSLAPTHAIGVVRYDGKE